MYDWLWFVYWNKKRYIFNNIPKINYLSNWNCNENMLKVYEITGQNHIN